MSPWGCAYAHEGGVNDSMSAKQRRFEPEDHQGQWALEDRVKEPELAQRRDETTQTMDSESFVLHQCQVISSLRARPVLFSRSGLTVSMFWTEWADEKGLMYFRLTVRKAANATIPL